LLKQKLGAVMVLKKTLFMEQDNVPIPDGINTLKLLWLQEKFKFAQ
jgi:hypothetical protein